MTRRCMRSAFSRARRGLADVILRYSLHRPALQPWRGPHVTRVPVSQHLLHCSAHLAVCRPPCNAEHSASRKWDNVVLLPVSARRPSVPSFRQRRAPPPFAPSLPPSPILAHSFSSACSSSAPHHQEAWQVRSPPPMPSARSPPQNHPRCQVAPCGSVRRVHRLTVTLRAVHRPPHQAMACGRAGRS